MQIRHSVIIITYNQEHLIGRALESVLCQKDYLYEIVVCDDCSVDKTWEVIQQYKGKHDDIIKPFRNEQNLGIFGNIESTWTKANGNIIWYLSGDDEYCNGLFAKANEIVNANNINPDIDYFSLYFDFDRVYPNEKHKTHSNVKILKHDPISLKLRNLIYNRTVGVSNKVYKSYFPVRKDIGIAADGLIDIQTQLFSNKNFYYPLVGSIYYTDIGIGSITKRQNYLQSQILCTQEFFKLVENLKKDDVNWLKFLIHKAEFELRPSLKVFKNMLMSFFQSLNFKYGIRFYLKHIMYCIDSLVKGILNKLILVL